MGLTVKLLLQCVLEVAVVWLSLLLVTGSLVLVFCLQGLPISMYGGTLIPSHPQLADGPGGPLFNGLHTPDPAWNPMIKVVQNSTECTDAQQVV